MIIALLVLYGDPKITESLELAWQRCRESSAWRNCIERDPDFCGSRSEHEDTPFIFYVAPDIARYFEKYFLPNLPGESEKEKLQRIFERAPSWLVYFTCADIYARLLSISIPDVSSLSRFWRYHSGFLDSLLTGPFDYQPLPDGAIDPFYGQEEQEFALASEGMTHRERKRALKLLRSTKGSSTSDSA
jgi:hypothetical protein